MNKPQMIDLVLQCAGEYDHGTYTKEAINSLLDEMQYHVVAKFMTPRTHLFQGIKTITTQVGVYLYDKPDGLVDDPIGVIVLDAEDRIVRMIVDPDIQRASDSRNRAFGWKFFGESIWLYPTPDSVTTYRVIGRYYPDPLLNEREEGTGEYPESTLPRLMQTLVCYNAAMEIVGGPGDPSKNYRFLASRAESIEKTLRTTVLSRGKVSNSFCGNRFTMRGRQVGGGF